MRIRHGYEIILSCNQPTAMICLLSVHSERAGDILKPAELATLPALPVTSYRDGFGNLCHRFVAPAGDLTITADGVVDVSGAPDAFCPDAAEIPAGELPDDCLIYLLGSRYCETDKLSQIAWDMFGHLPAGWGRVQAICDYVHGHLRFDYLKADSTRSALEAWQGGIGVCRDFAHLAIALCRCLNIPARYVNGYLGDIGVPVVDPMDFSAWIEVYLGGAWHTFDPRNNIRRIGRIVVARGRDAADIPLINSFGAHRLKSFRVWTYNEDDPPQNARQDVTSWSAAAATP